MPSLIELIRWRRQAASLTRKRFKPGKPGRPRYPLAIEKSYRRQTRRWANDARQVLRQVLKPALADLAREAGIDVPRQDAYPDTLRNLMALARATFATLHPSREAERLARDYFDQTDRRNKADTLAMFRRVVGVDVFLNDPWMAAESSAFVEQNVDLITSIPEDYFTQVERQVLGGLRSGTRVEDLASTIEDRFPVTAARAELIARDQIGKLNGQMSMLRQEEVGVKKYIWRTADDERVRGKPDGKYPDAEPSHWKYEGQTFSWDNPPDDTGHPGQDYQCRCIPEPIIDLDALL